MEKEQLKSYLLAYAEQELNLYSDNNFECPYCKNKRSFAIFTETNSFSCFNPSCKWNESGKKKGDIFDLVGLLTGLIEFPAKIQYLEGYIQDNNLKPTKSKKKSSNNEGTKTPAERMEASSSDEVEEYIPISKSWINERHEALMNNEKALNQLRFRKIDDDTIKKFKFGFIPAIKKELRIFEEHNFNSIVIPFPESNHFIRWNYNHEQNGFTKYIEQGHKEIFNRKIIGRTERPIFVCEGIFDSISIIQEGFESISLCSVSSVELFLRYLKTHQPKNNLIILLDNDEAGKEASSSLCAGLWEQEIIFQRNETMIPTISKTFKKHFKDINEIVCYSDKSRAVLKAFLTKAEEYASKDYERLYSKKFRRQAIKKNESK